MAEAKAESERRLEEDRLKQQRAEYSRKLTEKWESIHNPVAKPKAQPKPEPEWLQKLGHAPYPPPPTRIGKDVLLCSPDCPHKRSCLFQCR